LHVVVLPVVVPDDPADAVARTLGIIGIVVGLLGIGVAGYALTRRDSAQPPTAPPPSAAT